MADTKSLVLLGSTGSIGVQALEVAQGAGYRVAALAAGSRVEPFEEQIRRYRPAAAAMFDEKAQGRPKGAGAGSAGADNGRHGGPVRAGGLAGG